MNSVLPSLLQTFFISLHSSRLLCPTWNYSLLESGMLKIFSMRSSGITSYTGLWYHNKNIVFKTLNWRLTKCKLQIQFHYNDGIQEKKNCFVCLFVAWRLPTWSSCPAHMTLNDSLKHNELEGVHYVIFLILCQRDHKKIKQCEQKKSYECVKTSPLFQCDPELSVTIY